MKDVARTGATRLLTMKTISQKNTRAPIRMEVPRTNAGLLTDNRIAPVCPKTAPSGAAGSSGDRGAAPGEKSRNWAAQARIVQDTHTRTI